MKGNTPDDIRDDDPAAPWNEDCYPDDMMIEYVCDCGHRWEVDAHPSDIESEPDYDGTIYHHAQRLGTCPGCGEQDVDGVVTF